MTRAVKHGGVPQVLHLLHRRRLIYVSPRTAGLNRQPKKDGRQVSGLRKLVMNEREERGSAVTVARRPGDDHRRGSEENRNADSDS